MRNLDGYGIFYGMGMIVVVILGFRFDKVVFRLFFILKEIFDLVKINIEYYKI